MFEDQSLVYMFSNYMKRLTLTDYGGNNSWAKLTGFEQVVSSGNTTYYLIDNGNSRIVSFDKYWIYLSYQTLPYNNTFTTKYVAGNFYFSAKGCFYSTNTNFTVLNAYAYKIMITFEFTQFFYDASSSQFYVLADTAIYVFSSSCALSHDSLSQTITNYALVGLSFYNGTIYGGIKNTNQIIAFNLNSNNSANITVSQCPTPVLKSYITFDSFGFMAISCEQNNVIPVYDYNGNYTNSSISTSYQSGTAIDSSGRLLIMNSNSLDIYY